MSPAGTSGRRAAVPGGGYARPSRRADHGLSVRCSTEDGARSRTFSFATVTGPESLTRELVDAFEVMTGPAGTWRRPSTWTEGAQAIRYLLRHLATRRPQPKSIADLTPARWATLVLSGPAGRCYADALRPLLLTCQTLPPQTRAVLTRRQNRRRAAPPQSSYSAAELRRIRVAATHTVQNAARRLAHAERLIADTRNPAADNPGLAECLTHLARTGALPRTASGAYLHPRALRAAGGPIPTIGMVFPTVAEMGALAVLLAATLGWNAGVIFEMRVPTERPDDHDQDLPTLTAALDKPRRPIVARHTTNTLVDAGPGSSGRVMNLAIEMTHTARTVLAAQVSPTDRLLVTRRDKTGRDGRLFTLGVPQAAVGYWSASAGLLDDHGAPLAITLQTLRRTVIVLRGARQHSDTTHERTYLSRDRRVREESRDVVEEGTGNAVAHAHATMRLLTDTDDGPDGRIAGGRTALTSGRRDTALGSCTDYEHSPFTPAGPCAVSFLLCLACPNAVATARHLPRLVHLHDALEQLRGSVPGSVWEADWAAHWSRLTDLLDRHATIDERSNARRQLTDTDRAIIDAVLSRRLQALR